MTQHGKTIRTVVARVSSKYQVVIPKPVREILGIQPQDKLLFLLDGDTVVLRPQPTNFTEALQGLHKDIWPEDPDAWLEKERSEWE
jgi:AbrB family looped-hinge helix DNA binding protein